MVLEFDIERGLANNCFFCLGCGELYKDGKKLWQHFCQTHCTAEELRDFGSTMQLLAEANETNNKKSREGNANESDKKNEDAVPQVPDK